MNNVIVNSKEILLNARNNKSVVFQFNINNLEWTRYILEACQQISYPVILGVSEGAIKYMGGYNTVVSLVNGLVKDLNITIPVVIHLDHGSSYESCEKAIIAGFSSVMIDASKYPLDQNIEITKKVISLANQYNVSVEGEVGSIGGVEDNINSEVAYALIEDVIRYVNETKVDSIASAVGSVHGIYKGEPNIKLDLITDIYDNINIPLVLHGGSGISDTIIKNAIACGISKININTELQVRWNKAVREYINLNESIYDPRKIISSGKQAIIDTIIEMINKYRVV